MTTHEGPRSANSEGRHDDPFSVPPLDETHPPCGSRKECRRYRTKARCWDDSFTEQAVRDRLAEDDALVKARVRLLREDVRVSYLDRKADPPGPWPEDARVPSGFYPPPRGAA